MSKTISHTTALDSGTLSTRLSKPCSLIVIASKKNTDKPHFCADYWKLNVILRKKGQWPIPHFDDIVASVGPIWQVPMASDEDAAKTAFVTQSGQYGFRVLSYGIASVPSVFQELMSRGLEGGIGKFLLVYCDGVLVYSNPISVGPWLSCKRKVSN